MSQSLGERFMEMLSDSAQRIVPELGAELGRLGVQGQMEMASAIFGNSAFVPYGPGQYTPSNDNQGMPNPEVQSPQIEPPEQSRGGMHM